MTCAGCSFNTRIHSELSERSRRVPVIMRSRRTHSWKDRKFNTVLQGSCGFGSERGVMGAGSGIDYRSDRGAGPGGRSAEEGHRMDERYAQSGYWRRPFF